MNRKRARKIAETKLPQIEEVKVMRHALEALRMSDLLVRALVYKFGGDVRLSDVDLNSFPRRMSATRDAAGILRLSSIPDPVPLTDEEAAAKVAAARKESVEVSAPELPCCEDPCCGAKCSACRTQSGCATLEARRENGWIEGACVTTHPAYAISPPDGTIVEVKGEAECVCFGSPNCDLCGGSGTLPILDIKDADPVVIGS